MLSSDSVERRTRESRSLLFMCVCVSVVMLCSTFDRVVFVCVERKNICPIHLDGYVVSVVENDFRSYIRYRARSFTPSNFYSSSSIFRRSSRILSDFQATRERYQRSNKYVLSGKSTNHYCITNHAV